jgi:hypothetical protein
MSRCSSGILSVADFVPDEDADGRYARRLVDLVASLFTPRSAPGVGA